MKTLYSLALAMLCLACNTKNKEITNESDYIQYLQDTPNSTIEMANSELDFWNKKYQATPNQPPYLSKLAAAESSLFEATGKLDHLTKAGTYLEEAVSKTNRQSAGAIRSLARNYISQHRFQEAKHLLMEAYELGENKDATNKMLYDVALEIGDYDLAKEKLTLMEDEGDFDYLIRLAKWQDVQGNLDAAIFNLQLATQKAEELKNDNLKLWAYSNIADFYGHAGKLKESYEHYLKALAINPNSYYSLKGIAWIAFSGEKNTAKANKILDYVMQHHQAPDYHLLKAEIAAFDGDEQTEQAQKAMFYAKLDEKNYGDMYNKYLVLEDPKSNIKIAQKEVENRPTPESYDLYAWALLNNSQKAEALEIVKNHIEGKTSEPEVLYHVAEVYKANGLESNVVSLKPELLASAYELGPILSSKIEKL